MRDTINLVKAAFAAAALGIVPVTTACDSEPKPYVPTPDVREPVSGTIRVTVDRAHPSLVTDLRHPQSEPVSVTVEGTQLAVEGFAKTLALRPELLAVELYLANQTTSGIRDLTATVTADVPIIDLSHDPFSEKVVSGSLTPVGIAPEGVTPLRFAVPAEGEHSR